MMPSLPVDISKGSRAKVIFDPDRTFTMPIVRVELLETKGDALECSMRRGEFRCSNETYIYIVAHASNGYTYLIPFCQMCVDDSGDGWLQSLERLVNGT